MYLMCVAQDNSSPSVAQRCQKVGPHLDRDEFTQTMSPKGESSEGPKSLLKVWWLYLAPHTLQVSSYSMGGCNQFWSIDYKQN